MSTLPLPGSPPGSVLTTQDQWHFLTARSVSLLSAAPTVCEKDLESPLLDRALGPPPLRPAQPTPIPTGKEASPRVCVYIYSATGSQGGRGARLGPAENKPGSVSKHKGASAVHRLPGFPARGRTPTGPDRIPRQGCSGPLSGPDPGPSVMPPTSPALLDSAQHSRGFVDACHPTGSSTEVATRSGRTAECCAWGWGTVLKRGRANMGPEAAGRSVPGPLHAHPPPRLES